MNERTLNKKLKTLGSGKIILVYGLRSFMLLKCPYANKSTNPVHLPQNTLMIFTKGGINQP